MEKKTAIELAQNFSEFNPAEKYFVTDDEKVFTEAEKAVSHAMQLSAGNPKVIEVFALEFDAAKAPSKADKVAAAKTKVAAMQAIVDEKTTAKETAEGNKKGAATVALKKATANLELAQKKLVDAEALTEE